MFVANDIAKALGYSDVKSAIKQHCKGVVKHPTIKNGGGYPEKFISEGDMYRLIVRSKLSSAQKFEAWVMDEVLPQIRKTGGYIPVAEDDDEKTILAKALKIQQRTLEEKDSIIAQKNDVIKMQSKDVAVLNMLTNTSGTLSMKEFADTLGIKGLGRNSLYALLREMGIVTPTSTLPYRQYIEEKKFVVVQSVAKNGELVSSTRVTPKGQVWLTKKVLKQLNGKKSCVDNDVVNYAKDIVVGLLGKSYEEYNAMCIHPILFGDAWTSVAEIANGCEDFDIAIKIEEMIYEF